MVADALQSSKCMQLDWFMLLLPRSEDASSIPGVLFCRSVDFFFCMGARAAVLTRRTHAGAVASKTALRSQDVFLFSTRRLRQDVF